MRLSSLLRLVVLALGLLGGAAQAQAPAAPPSAALPPLGSFTTQQRQEIIAIIREALRTDASLLRDAITALQEEEERAKMGAARGMIGELAPALFRDPEDPVAGNPNGDVTIVEFFDVRCPYCRRMVPVVNELIRRDPGVRVVFKDFPILGPASTLGARALLAAHKQGGYVKMYMALMTGGPSIDEASLRAAAARAGLDAERLVREMASPEIVGRINANLALGRRLDLQGTPAYVIGDQVLPGAVDLPTLTAAVAAARRKPR
jgi:protein-disulfide isomerase